MAIVLPHVFQDNVNETASGVQVNENFNVLRNAIEALEPAIARLPPLPHYFATGNLSGNLVTGSEHTITVAAGTLVAWRAYIHGATGSGTSGFSTCNLFRDGVVVNNHVVEVCQNNLGQNGSLEQLTYVEAAGGTHAYKVEVTWGGTGFSGSVDPGMLSFTL